MRERQMYKYGKGVKNFDMQGGVRNYLGEQETVSDAPVKWQSGPDHPTTELAYITQAEKDLLLNQDLHNSLDGGPNRGPEGLMSLNGWGDADQGFGSDGVDSGNSGDQDNSGYDGGSGRDNSYGNSVDTSVQTDAVGPASWNNDTITTTSTTSPKENYGAKYTGNGFFNKLFGGANKYGYQDTYGGLGANRNDTKPGYAGRALGGLFGLATGIPFVGSSLGNIYDKGKSFFSPKPRDMSKFNDLGLAHKRIPTAQGDYDLLGNKIDETIDTTIFGGGDEGSGGVGIKSLPNVVEAETIVDPLVDNQKEFIARFMPPKSALQAGVDTDKIKDDIEEMTANWYNS